MQVIKNKRFLYIILSAFVLGIFMHSCANMASPQGGDYDFDPPVVLGSTPLPNQTQVKKGKIEIIFDELVQLEKPSEKVIITPPQQNIPIIRAQGNKVIVELKDTLLDNTTYTIDFTDAIKDNNEGNVLENFAISFSTGNTVDSLQISGRVLAADNLEPIAGMYVGIHSDLSDTAFTKKPFLRISRTNEQGIFSIKGIAEGRYKVYALNDLNRDYKYDNLGESIAFLDTIISPYTQQATRYDSIFSVNPKNIKEILFDSLQSTEYTKYLPNDIVLRSFISPFKRQYLQKHERSVDNNSFSITFAAATELPTIEALDPNIDISDWTILERNITNDTLKYWITQKDINAMDTLRLKVSYIETDTLNMPQLKTDTLNFIDRTKSKKKKEEKKKDKEEIEFLSIKTNINQVLDLKQKVNIEFDVPVKDFESENIRLQHFVDSVHTDIVFSFEQDSLNPRKFGITYDWQPGEHYQLSIDSATVFDYNDRWNNKIDIPFKIKNIDEYGNLFINIHSLVDSIPAFVELLDKSDNPVRKANVEDGGALFMNLNPGTYYARIIIDTNGNGKWDPGNYEKKIEPEMVYYYPKNFEIKANWDIEEDWNILSVPIEKQKPLDITKNKPKSEEAKRKLLERKEAQNQKRNNRQNNNNNRNNQGNTLNNQTMNTY